MTVKQAGMSLFSLQTCFKEFPFFTRGVRTDKSSHASFSSPAFVCSKKTYGNARGGNSQKHHVCFDLGRKKPSDKLCLSDGRAEFTIQLKLLSRYMHSSTYFLI